MGDEEFEVLINDVSKQINENIAWVESPSRSAVVEFKKVKVDSEEGYPLFINGSYNRIIFALSFTLVHRKFGRIYGLDLGKDHRNPDGRLVGEKHKHRWSEIFRDKQAYRPDDITESATSPVGVWQQFCMEANIVHNGTIIAPPPLQLEIL
jgi:hypothetical protein